LKEKLSKKKIRFLFSPLTVLLEDENAIYFPVNGQNMNKITQRAIWIMEKSKCIYLHPPNRMVM
jgi:hypothetical protein